MKIAVLSGKGGTGKTTVSASLAASIKDCQYIDCDVEEPNGALFLRPHISKSIPVNVKVPNIDINKCTGCGDCAKACQFNAIAVVKGKVLVFSEICHHCGACGLACPTNAIHENERSIGVIEQNESTTFMHGKLNVGEPISIPIISELKSRIKKDVPVIIDCPPGASCAVVASIEDTDFCILVTEPTPFGLHDFKIAVQLVEKMNIPYGVVINKATKDVNIIHAFCKDRGIEILMEIPFSKEIARAYSKGYLPVHDNPEWQNRFFGLYQKLERRTKI